ncbi:MAG: prepilin-type N-terminal cleavage/methylation domain-containing protein [Deltaproteobacteria bacterium]|nr:prepilin-type N-terminal cleavage/methylation domain-containing protein [Deltaproteobacteria bacterium]
MSRRARGLSLVEVLVALAVASMSMAAVAASALGLLSGRRDGELRQVATLIAERGLEELLGRGAEGLVEGEWLDLVRDASGEFARRVTVEAGPSDGLWHLAVAVTPPRGKPAVEFHTLLRRPWSSP